MGPKAILDFLAKRKSSCPCWELNTIPGLSMPWPSRYIAYTILAAHSGHRSDSATVGPLYLFIVYVPPFSSILSMSVTQP